MSIPSSDVPEEGYTAEEWEDWCLLRASEMSEEHFMIAQMYSDDGDDESTALFIDVGVAHKMEELRLRRKKRMCEQQEQREEEERKKKLKTDAAESSASVSASAAAAAASTSKDKISDDADATTKGRDDRAVDSDSDSSYETSTDGSRSVSVSVSSSSDESSSDDEAMSGEASMEENELQNLVGEMAPEERRLLDKSIRNDKSEAQKAAGYKDVHREWMIATARQYGEDA